MDTKFDTLFNIFTEKIVPYWGSRKRKGKKYRRVKTNRPSFYKLKKVGNVIIEIPLSRRERINQRKLGREYQVRLTVKPGDVISNVPVARPIEKRKITMDDIKTAQSPQQGK